MGKATSIQGKTILRQFFLKHLIKFTVGFNLMRHHISYHIKIV